MRINKQSVGIGFYKAGAIVLIGVGVWLFVKWLPSFVITATDANEIVDALLHRFEFWRSLGMIYGGVMMLLPYWWPYSGVR